jgi:hypothetical protein
MTCTSEEQAPVDVTENVLRRVHKDHFDGTLRIPFRPAAFKPTESDQDGLSVYRERFVSPSEVASSGRIPGAYYVVRLAVQDLQRLNLSVVPTPGPLIGHAVIPELNRAFYQREKQRSKDLQLELCRLASRAIVHVPDIS